MYPAPTCTPVYPSDPVPTCTPVDPVPTCTPVYSSADTHHLRKSAFKVSCECGEEIGYDLRPRLGRHPLPQHLNRATRRAIVRKAKRMGRTQRTPQNSRPSTPISDQQQQHDPSAAGPSQETGPASDNIRDLLQSIVDRLAAVESRSLANQPAELPTTTTGGTPMMHTGATQHATSAQDANRAATGLPHNLQHPVGNNQMPHNFSSVPFLHQPSHAFNYYNHPASVPTQPSSLGGRDEIPTFYGETPASLGLQRNREVESWISSIELLTIPSTHEAFIRMARGRARGYAQMVLLGPLFEGVTAWPEFRAKLRAKFRGASTSQHFLEMMAQTRMVPGQGPLDFYQAVEMAAMQGRRDYPGEIGDFEGLVRRTFTAGLPAWLRKQLLLLDFPSTSKMAEKCQAAWDATVGARNILPPINSTSWAGHAHYPRPSIGASFSAPMALGTHTPDQLTGFEAPPLEFYSDGPLQVAPVQPRPSQTQPKTTPRPQASQNHSGGARSSQWCDYHQSRTHNTSECQAKQNQCYKCGNVGHFAARCPFQSSRPGQNSHPAAGNGNFRGSSPTSGQHSRTTSSPTDQRSRPTRSYVNFGECSTTNQDEAEGQATYQASGEW